jgi:hypothetical protein
MPSPPSCISQRGFILVTGDCIQFSGPETRRLVSAATYLVERNKIVKELAGLFENVKWENKSGAYGREFWKYSVGRWLGMRGTGRVYGQ